MSNAQKYCDFDKFEKLNALRHERIFIDVTISIGGRKYLAHKIVLCSMSDFFKAMFTSDFEEKNSSNAKIDEEHVNADVFEQIIEFGYTSKIEITERNALYLFEACQFLLLESLQKAATQFLSENLKNENFVKTYSAAIKYDCRELL